MGWQAVQPDFPVTLDHGPSEGARERESALAWPS